MFRKLACKFWRWFYNDNIVHDRVWVTIRFLCLGGKYIYVSPIGLYVPVGARGLKCMDTRLKLCTVLDTRNWLWTGPAEITVYWG